MNPGNIPYKRLRGLILARLAVAIFTLIIASAAFNIGRSSFQALVASLFLVSVLYGLLLKHGTGFHIHAYLQAFVDVAIISSIVHFSGGIESVLDIFYVLPIIYSGIIISRRGSFIVTAATCGMYSLIVILELTGVLALHSGRLGFYGDPLQVLYILYIKVTIYSVVSFLSNYLVRSLQERSSQVSELERRNEVILQSMMSGLIATDNDGMVIYHNRAAEEMLDAGPEDIDGRRVTDLLGDEIADGMASPGERHDREVTAAGGKKTPLWVNTSVFRDEKGKGAGYIFSFQDLSRLKEMERKMKQSERLAGMGQLAAEIAHEVRNPVNSISGSVELLRKKTALHMAESKLFDVIIKETERLDRIIREFLDYANPKKLERRVCDLKEIVDDVLFSISTMHGMADPVNVKKVFPAGTFEAYADPEQMKHVFFNIILNAHQAMPGGGSLVITGAKNGWISIAFKDNGPGIPKPDAGRIFEPFYSRKKGGTGMGLALANRIVSEHGGRIDVESSAGNGSTFIVRIPQHGAGE